MVLVRSHLRRGKISEPTVRRLAQRILTAAGEPRAQLSIILVGDRRMQQLNRRYRRLNRPTDVLSFPTREAPGPASSLLGDVVISLHTAARQARAAGHSVNREVAVLLVHGILHLLGYDHGRSDQEARRMLNKERAIMKALGRTAGVAAPKRGRTHQRAIRP